MTTLAEVQPETINVKPIVERRQHRRHDLETRRYPVARLDADLCVELGQLVDLSAGGVRIRTGRTQIRPQQQIRVRLELPNYAGICPFIDSAGGDAKPKTQWVGWMLVTRVQWVDEGQYDVAGRLLDMQELDRGMLGLYLSTQPLAA